MKIPNSYYINRKIMNDYVNNNVHDMSWCSSSLNSAITEWKSINKCGSRLERNVDRLELDKLMKDIESTND